LELYENFTGDVGLDKDPRRHWYGSPLDVDQNVQILKALVSVLIIKN